MTMGMGIGMVVAGSGWRVAGGAWRRVVGFVTVSLAWEVEEEGVERVCWDVGMCVGMSYLNAGTLTDGVQGVVCVDDVNLIAATPGPLRRDRYAGAA